MALTTTANLSPATQRALEEAALAKAAAEKAMEMALEAAANEARAQTSQTPWQILSDKKISRDARLLLVLLSKFAAENGECSPGHDTLCDLMHAHKNSVTRWLTELENAGHLVRQNRGNKPNLFVLRTLIWCYNSAEDNPGQNSRSAPKRAVYNSVQNSPHTPLVKPDIYINYDDDAHVHTREGSSSFLQSNRDWEQRVWPQLRAAGLCERSCSRILNSVRAGEFCDPVLELEGMIERDRVAESRARIERQLSYLPFREIKASRDGLLMQAIVSDYSAPEAFHRAKAAADRDTNRAAKKLLADETASEKIRRHNAEVQAELRYAETLPEHTILEMHERARQKSFGSRDIANVHFHFELRDHAKRNGVQLAVAS